MGALLTFLLGRCHRDKASLEIAAEAGGNILIETHPDIRHDNPLQGFFGISVVECDPVLDLIAMRVVRMQRRCNVADGERWESSLYSRHVFMEPHE